MIDREKLMKAVKDYAAVKDWNFEIGSVVRGVAEVFIEMMEAAEEDLVKTFWNTPVPAAAIGIDTETAGFPFGRLDVVCGYPGGVSYLEKECGPSTVAKAPAYSPGPTICCQSQYDIDE